MKIKNISHFASSFAAAVLLAVPTVQGAEQFVDVVATGYGTTVREATKAALRSAVEQVVGTMIDATTLVENDKLIEDEILTYSAGMIATSKAIGEPKKSADGIYTVKVNGFLVMTSLKSGSAFAFKVDQNLLNAIFASLDTGSIAIEVTLQDAVGAEMAQSYKALCEKRTDSTDYLSLFSFNPGLSSRQLGFIMPFFSSKWQFVSGCGYESEVQSVDTFQISLGKFTPEELKSVGKLGIKVGHMKGNQFLK